MKISEEFFDQFADLIADRVVERMRSTTAQEIAAEPQKPEHGSRLKRMFPELQKADEAKRDAEPRPDSVKGFLAVHCPSCHHFFTTFVKEPVFGMICKECGAGISLRHSTMTAARVHCNCCGNYLKYRTNARGQDMIAMEIACRQCGAPVDLQWHDARGEYMPIART